jgi:hypothetical protein
MFVAWLIYCNYEHAYLKYVNMKYSMFHCILDVYLQEKSTSMRWDSLVLHPLGKKEEHKNACNES